MKKFVIGLVLAMAMGVSAIPVFAAPAATLAYRPQQVVYDETAAVENYIAVQEARKGYLQDIYSRGLITKELYDLNIANIEASIAYVEENGLGASYGGYGYGGCCGGFGMGR